MPITETTFINEVKEENESISSLFDSNEKYHGVRSPENITRDFMVRNGKITEKTSKSGGDSDSYGKRMSADFKNQQPILSQEDGLNDIFDKEPVRSVSEALWDEEDGGDNEPDWRKFLEIHGHTPDVNDGDERVLLELTKKEKNEAIRRTFFGRDRY